jgi:acyl CoA:acetate/3-ketoacid CoA transferase beta subunit
MTKSQKVTQADIATTVSDMGIGELARTEALRCATLGLGLTLVCARYIYSGTPVLVTSDAVVLSNAVIPFDTGELKDAAWTNSAPLPHGSWVVMFDGVESFGAMK